MEFAGSMDKGSLMRISPAFFGLKAPGRGAAFLRKTEFCL